jgi:hypothetical protein
MEVALVLGNRIENVIVADSVQWAAANLGGEWIDITGLPGVGIGWTRNQGVWSPPAAVVAEIPPAVLEANAIALANRIALQKSVEADLDSLSDDDLSTITYLFDDWVGDGRALKVGAKVRFDGVLYRVLQQHNTQPDWAPPGVPALFTPFRNPAAQPQPWVQPQGGHDAYATGARVTHKGQTWTNTHIGGNVWEPGVFGWAAT